MLCSLMTPHTNLINCNGGYQMKFKLIEDVEMSNEYDSEGNQLSVKQAEFFKNSKVRDS